jgi:hypothetical protein
MKGRTHEKWLQSREGSKPWYCILPNGEVRIDDGNLTLVGRVDPRYHENPLWFVEKKTLPQRSIAEDFPGTIVVEAGVNDSAVLGETVLEVGSEGNVDAREAAQNAIVEHVAARLNERLQSMTVEERAKARGLLRLQRDGRLGDYLENLFSGNNGETVDVEMKSADEYSIFYLIDHDFLRTVNAGHAAMIMGSDSEGWYYFSFGIGTTDKNAFTADGNLDVDYFSSLAEARSSERLARYDNYLRWNLEGASAVRAAFREATDHLSANYNIFTQNCDDIASEIIRASGVDLDDVWKPSHTFDKNRDDADESGQWYLPDFR